MRLPLLLALVLCAVLSAGDRRRPERGDGGDQEWMQHRRRDGDQRQHHHHHDSQRWQRRRQSDDDDNADDDEEHHHQFVDLADSDGSHWRHGHDHHEGYHRHLSYNHHENRQEVDGYNQRSGQVGRHDGQKDVKKTGKKDGTKNRARRPDNSHGADINDGEHHQESRRRTGNHYHEHHEHREDVSKKSHSKKDKKASRQGAELPQGRHPTREGIVETGAQFDDPWDEPSNSHVPRLEPSSAAAESLAAALAEPESETALSGSGEPGAEPLPPPHQDVAAMARYIVHVSDWAAMATISTRSPTKGMPFANVFSVCDGTRYRSTGIPYLYLTDMEISVKDLRVNNSASLTMSLAQTDFCRRRGYDPEDPLCAHVILTGRVLQVDEQDPEFVFARDALFARHPEMSSWPAGHHFFVAKLDIQNIIVLDFFGGAKTVPVPEYFATNPFKVHPRLENML